MISVASSFAGECVLVTGAGGFIGSHLVRRLASDGARVLAFARDKKKRLQGSKARIVGVDVTDAAAVKKIVVDFQPNSVFHLAALTKVERDAGLVAKMSETNVGGTINAIEACIAAGSVEAFVNTGTCEEYGNIDVPFSEEMVPRPPSPYAASKAAATTFCTMYHDSFGFPSLTLRPFFTYGPGQGEGRFLPELIKAALAGKEFAMTGGKQTREYNYVDDIVEGYLLAAREKRALGQVINLGCGHEISVIEMARKVVALVGKGSLKPGVVPYRDNEVWRLFCSNEKARKLLGWKPKTGLDEGLRKTIEWYSRNSKQ